METSFVSSIIRFVSRIAAEFDNVVTNGTDSLSLEQLAVLVSTLKVCISHIYRKAYTNPFNIIVSRGTSNPKYSQCTIHIPV
jgi:hypothetical protein